jgi:hypothetical protein
MAMEPKTEPILEAGPEKLRKNNKLKNLLSQVLSLSEK